MAELVTLEGREAYEALRRAAAVRLERDVVRAEGPDAASFLQGQLSQDLRGLTDGSSTWALLLEPQGRITALLRVTRLSETSWLLDTDPGVAPAMLERLSRFKLRTKVDFDVAGWSVLALRGANIGSGGVESGGVPALSGVGVPEAGGGPALAAWPGMTGVDLLDPGGRPIPDGLAVVGPQAYEVLRVEVGVPVMGAEVTERTLPAEAGVVPYTVSFTKGCYTGQELVARIDSRGSHVPRHLRGFRFAAPVPAGTELSADGRKVGWVTSVVESPGLGWVGLGYLGRALEVPTTVLAGDVVAEAQDLPLRAS